MNSIISDSSFNPSPNRGNKKLNMKIQLNNFGPIKKFDFDLTKDLTVIFGKNNIGKSYAISAIYLIIKSFLSENFIDFKSMATSIFFYRNDSHFGGNNRNRQVKIIQQVESLIEKKMKEVEIIDLTENFEKIFNALLSSSIIPNLEKSFVNSFKSFYQNHLTEEPFSIIIQFNSFEFSIKVNNGKMGISKMKFYESIFIEKSKSTKKPKRTNKKYTLYYNVKKKDNSGLFDIIFLDYYSLFQNEITEVINNVYFLPASRSGLYQALSAFNAIIAELAKSRSFLSSPLELPNIPEPLLDYFIFLANISDRYSSKQFAEIAKIIEDDILKGSVSFDNKSRKLLFKQANVKEEFDLAFTSSMISEIAPIAAFLKYIITTDRRVSTTFRYNRFVEDTKKIKQYNLIFIEEPEAHLHPEIQVKLMQIFCEIVKCNVKIVMTSHSNYMFNKLSNLILEKSINHNTVASYLMLMGKEGSISDSLAMAADKEGMNDKNFINTTEELYKERITIYDKLNEDAN